MSEEQNVTQTESTTQETQQADTQAKPFEIPTEAQELVGEGKKYASAEEALRSVPHAQQHIKTLEEEMAQLKEELSKRKTTQELLDEIKSGVTPAENTTQEVGLSQDKIMEMVNQTLKQNEAKQTAKQNAATVANKFTEQYGAEAEEVYGRLAKELNLTTSQLNDLATRSPNVVLRLAGFNSSTSNVSRPTSSVNTEALSKNKPQAEVSARVPRGASTKDLVSAWRAAGEKIKQQS
jgi:DNA repair exonuclease SbcCD ATPase subunit